MPSGSPEGAGKREGSMSGETAKEVDVKTRFTSETAERCEARGAAECTNRVAQGGVLEEQASADALRVGCRRLRPTPTLTHHGPTVLSLRELAWKDLT